MSPTSYQTAPPRVVASGYHARSRTDPGGGRGACGGRGGGVGQLGRSADGVASGVVLPLVAGQIATTQRVLGVVEVDVGLGQQLLQGGLAGRRRRGARRGTGRC